MSIEKIEKDNELLAIIVRRSIQDPLNFVTPDEFPIQLGFHNRKKGEEVSAHSHRPIEELKNLPAHEMFHVIQGKVQFNIFDNKKELTKQVILEDGDTIFSTSGHSVVFLEDSKVLEVKQGPYRGKEEEKEFF